MLTFAFVALYSILMKNKLFFPCFFLFLSSSPSGSLIAQSDNDLTCQTFQDSKILGLVTHMQDHYSPLQYDQFISSGFLSWMYDGNGQIHFFAASKGVKWKQRDGGISPGDKISRAIYSESTLIFKSVCFYSQMFNSSGIFSVKERISSRSQWFGLCINSVWHNPVHLLVWVYLSACSCQSYHEYMLGLTCVVLWM